MPYIMQTVILLGLDAVLVKCLKPYTLRKWLGVTLLAAGLVGSFTISQQQVVGFDLELLALLAVPTGVVLFLTRRRFLLQRKRHASFLSRSQTTPGLSASLKERSSLKTVIAAQPL